MDFCKSCKDNVSEAKYLLMNDRIYKSCPGCSKNAEQHVFYACPSAFGRTEKRITNYNPMGLQSHCGRCRAGNQGPYEEAIYCSDIKNKQGVIISEIRFLPMSKMIFPTYEDAIEFLLSNMPKRDNTYYYMKSKMDCLKNSFVLFQYDGQLIGYAVFEKEHKLAEPLPDNGFTYYGYYQFQKGSIRILDTPITADAFASIDSKFTGFNQSHQRKPVGILPALFELIYEDGITIGEEKEITIPEEINEHDGAMLKEGQKKQIVVNAYERNASARRRCLAYYSKLNNGKIKCEICGFNFGEVYGKNFEGKIHIHHVKELSTIGEEYEIDAINDLIPICPNCHMVAHSKRPALKPDDIKKLLHETAHKE